MKVNCVNVESFYLLSPSQNEKVLEPLEETELTQMILSPLD